MAPVAIRFCKKRLLDLEHVQASFIWSRVKHSPCCEENIFRNKQTPIIFEALERFRKRTLEDAAKLWENWLTSNMEERNKCCKGQGNLEGNKQESCSEESTWHQHPQTSIWAYVNLFPERYANVQSNATMETTIFTTWTKNHSSSRIHTANPQATQFVLG